MADYCKQCSIEFFGKDSKDLAVKDSADDKDSKYYYVICEGCGPTIVDQEGKCMHLGEHR